MFWIFIVGASLTFTISRALLSITARFGDSIQRLVLVHGISGIAVAIITWLGITVYDMQYSVMYVLVSWFLPQVLWLVWDISRFTIDWLLANWKKDIKDIVVNQPK